MLKMIFCARRRPELTREMFQTYWLNHHGPLFVKHAQEYRALRYVQSHTLETPLNNAMRSARGIRDEFDGVGEIWWKSEEDFMAAVGTAEVRDLRDIFLADEASFIDREHSALFFTREEILVDTSGGCDGRSA